MMKLSYISGLALLSGALVGISACAHGQDPKPTAPAPVAPVAAASPPAAPAPEPAPPPAAAPAPTPATPPIYFAFDEAVLQPAGEDELKGIARYMTQNPSSSLRISGYCDERGSTEYNIALGDRRTQAARGVLTSMGISSSRIDAVSFGEERPVDPGHDETAWSKNRRVELDLTNSSRAAR